MFHLFKKSEPEYSLAFFVFLVVGVIGTLLIAYVWLNRVEMDDASPRLSPSTLSYATEATPRAVRDAYVAELESLDRDIDEVVSGDGVLALAEDRFFAMSVPREILDEHFRTVLAVRQMKESGAITVLDARSGVEEMIAELARAAKAI